MPKVVILKILREEDPGSATETRVFRVESGAMVLVRPSDVYDVKDIQDPVPDKPGTAIWANTKDDPQASLDAFFLNSNGFWMDIRCRNYRPEQIHTWKPYSEHTPQPYD